MGAAASSVEKDDEITDSKEDIAAASSVEKDDELIGSKEDLDLGDVSKMKRRPCSVDPKLAANPRRRAPPINPKTCKEGSVSTGKDGQIYVISGGRWIKAEKKLEQRQKELIRERLTEKMAPTKKARAKAASKKNTSPTPAKRGRGTPKKSTKKSTKKAGDSKETATKRVQSTKKATPKTPARKRCPSGSKKGKSGVCVKK